MTLDEFNALVTRRDELDREHALACEVLQELAEERADTSFQRRKCSRLYDEREKLQAQIDAELAAERAAGL